MKRIIGIATVLAIANVAVAQTGIIQSPAYKECIALSNSNPAQALIKADEWLAIDNGVAAHHCRAMALYGLKRYSEAGESLNALRMIIPEENVALRSFVAKQAASAWTNATRADAALSVLDTQIEEMNNARGNNAANSKLTADLLLERARLNITYGKAVLAARDLDHAVSLTPLNVNVLIERAQTFELLGDPALARADAESALTLNPENPKARAVLARLDQKK